MLPHLIDKKAADSEPVSHIHSFSAVPSEDGNHHVLVIKNTRKEETRHTVKKDSLWVSFPDMGSDSHRGRILRTEAESHDLIE